MLHVLASVESHDQDRPYAFPFLWSVVSEGIKTASLFGLGTIYPFQTRVMHNSKLPHHTAASSLVQI